MLQDYEERIADSVCTVARQLCCRCSAVTWHDNGRQEQRFATSLWPALAILLRSGLGLPLVPIDVITVSSTSTTKAIIEERSINIVNTVVVVVFVTIVHHIDIISYQQLILAVKQDLMLSSIATSSTCAATFASALATLTNADTLTMKEALMAMLQRVALHCHLMERKIVLDWQLTLYACGIHHCAPIGASCAELMTAAATSRRHDALRLPWCSGFIADQTHCVLPIDQHLAEIVQECHLVKKGLGQGTAGVALLHPFEEGLAEYFTAQLVVTMTD